MGASGLEEPVLQILAPFFFCLSSSSLNFSVSLLLPTHTHACFQSSKESYAVYQNWVLGRKEKAISPSPSLESLTAEKEKERGVDYRRIFPASLLTLFIIFSVFVYESD